MISNEGSQRVNGINVDGQAELALLSKDAIYASSITETKKRRKKDVSSSSLGLNFLGPISQMGQHASSHFSPSPIDFPLALHDSTANQGQSSISKNVQMAGSDARARRGL